MSNERFKLVLDFSIAFAIIVDMKRGFQTMSKTEIEAQLAIMPEPVDNQELHDQLSALVVTGAIDTYAAKYAIEDGDWERARRLIEEANEQD